MQNQNLLYRIGLNLIKGIGNITAKHIIEVLGDAAPLFKEKASSLIHIPGINSKIIREIKNPDILRTAEKEIQFIERNNILPLFITEKEYPFRLKDCIDSPVMLYFKGQVDFNNAKVISIVGTRHATNYGKEITESLIKDLAEQDPEIIIVSGLAYGIDIIAHKAALQEKMSTLAVLAHGLDRIYPYAHRNIAIEMLKQGGLLTDFLSKTNPDRQNFVKRNRIVAGISDCTIVIESAEKGGALITANIADSYNRDVFAFPGKKTDYYSKGCNNLIRDKKAVLVQTAEDIASEMGWIQQKKEKVIQCSLFRELSGEEQAVIDLLSKTESIHLNLLSIELNLPVSKLSITLFKLEMDGIIRSLPGGIYRLI